MIYSQGWTEELTLREWDSQIVLGPLIVLMCILVVFWLKEHTNIPTGKDT